MIKNNRYKVPLHGSIRIMPECALLTYFYLLFLSCVKTISSIVKVPAISKYVSDIYKLTSIFHFRSMLDIVLTFLITITKR
tara:strand:- start:646 stop:888 length:243 start_codon:yes stop_codon:yes gene_type:complete